ncbi:MAG: CoA transferase [Thermodesulfobacteriota bacterium]|jgi:formyl-CoA transferase
MKPLTGLRILDLTRFLAGPYSTLLLGGLGAEVIKIEPPNEGEFARSRPPFAGPRGASLSQQTADDLGMALLHRSRNKKSVTLNLRTPAGVELFLRLCKKADVVVENFTPGTLARMGLGFAALQEANPRLILCSISGFGQSGPRREWRAYDPVIQAASGITSVTGYPDRPPVRCGAAVSDTTAPLLAVIGILSALQLREKTGTGEWVDISMQDSSFFLLPDLIEFLAAGAAPERMGNGHVGGAPFNVYQATDGYVALCGLSPTDWTKLLKAIGREELAGDPRFATILSRRDHRREVDAVVQEWIGQRTAAAAVDHLQRHQVPAAPVLSPAELLQDEHLVSRGMVVDLAHPVHGPVPGAKGIGMPIKFIGCPVAFDQPAPALGAHNDEIYGGLLGLDEGLRQQLRQQGVI